MPQVNLGNERQILLCPNGILLPENLRRGGLHMGLHIGGVAELVGDEGVGVLPVELLGLSRQEAYRRGLELLQSVGLAEKAMNYPDELSGGQKQRVAIARAMVNEPALILADEPTGALDSQTSRVVMDLFHEMHEKYHKTIVLITHNPALAEKCQRVLTLRDGLIVGERKGTGERAAL